MESMMRKLHFAAIEGDEVLLNSLLLKDSLILDKYQLSQVNYGISPLHIAAKLGHLNIVKTLVKESPDMCLASDIKGRNPLHLAIIKGQLDVVKDLVLAIPQVVRECTDSGDTVLQLCVKYNQLEVLKYLVDEVVDEEVLNKKDCKGNTILHLAMANKQVKIIEHLLMNDKVNKYERNGNGFTAMDIYVRSSSDSRKEEIWVAVRKAKLLKNTYPAFLLFTPDYIMKFTEMQKEWLVVAASLIASMAFQAVANPPGGFWQNDQDNSKNSFTGTSVMATLHKDKYNSYVLSTSLSLLASMIIIIYAIFKKPRNDRSSSLIVIAIAGMMYAYGKTIEFVTPSDNAAPYRHYRIMLFTLVAILAALVIMSWGPTFIILFQKVRRLSPPLSRGRV
ncbi:hypothetical protein Ancab_001934 [Ancistrocladus abbreviatus]